MSDENKTIVNIADVFAIINMALVLGTKLYNIWLANPDAPLPDAIELEGIKLKSALAILEEQRAKRTQ